MGAAEAANRAATNPSEIEAFVTQVITDRDQPVVLFALEWCEFCWSLRKLFAQCGMPYRSVDLDSAAYQRDDRGGQIRAALAARTGSRTIPQVFVAGEYIGGCTETLDLAKDGRLQRLLKSHGVACDENVRGDPGAVVPAWVQPRYSAKRDRACAPKSGSRGLSRSTPGTCPPPLPPPASAARGKAAADPW